MPPRSPLPQRFGLDAAWLRTPDRTPGGQGLQWPSMSAWLTDRVGKHADVARMLATRQFVYVDGRPVDGSDPCLPNTFVWFHRELREEPEVPGELLILHRDERIVVVDKPPFLSTIPRGNHVRQSVVVRLRDELGLPELSPVHRLDRVTSGVLMLTTERRWRSAYQTMFEHREVRKTYRALAPWRAELEQPTTVRNHIRKQRGVWQAEVVAEAEPNAETLVEMESRHEGLAVYRLSPHTGQTHQLRLHLCGLGAPIVGDPLYPEVLDVSIDDFTQPLQLLASDLHFTDPVDGTARHLASTRTLPIPADLLSNGPRSR